MPSLTGVEAWEVKDYLPAGAYTAKPVTTERDTSQSNNPMVVVDWRVQAGSYTGAQHKDKITVAESTLSRVVQFLEAAAIEVPQTEFDSYEQMADWVAEQVKTKNPTVEMVVRMEPGYKDPTKEYPKVAGYRRPGPGSDLPNDASGFIPSPQIADDDKPPF